MANPFCSAASRLSEYRHYTLFRKTLQQKTDGGHKNFCHVMLCKPFFRSVQSVAITPCSHTVAA